MPNIKQKLYNLLRRSEKYTKTDMVYLAKGGSWLTLGTIISAFAGLLLTIAFANILPKEIFGSYKYVLSFVGILSIPTLLGMGVAITQAVARGYEGSFIPALKIRIRWGLWGAFAGAALAGYYYFQGNNTLAIAFLIVAVFMPFLEPFGTYTNFLHGKKIFSALSKFDIYSQIVSAAVLIATIFLTRNLFIIIFVYLAIWMALRFFFLKTTIKKFPPNEKTDPETIPYGKHLSAVKIISSLSSNLDKILLWHFLGPAQVATYFLALTIPTRLNGLMRIFPRLAFPKLAQRSIPELKNTLIPKILKLFLLTAFTVILYIVFAPLIYKLFFPQYLDAAFYSQIFSLTLLAQPIAIFATVLSSHIKIKEIYFFNTISPILRAIFLFVLIPFLGIIGAVSAIIASKVLDSLVLVYLFKKLNS